MGCWWFYLECNAEKLIHFGFVLIKICISLNSFPSEVSSLVGFIFSVRGLLCCSFLSFVRSINYRKKFHHRPPAALRLHGSIVFAGLVWADIHQFFRDSCELFFVWYLEKYLVVKV